MAGKIRASDIEEVKARVNIADVIGDYVVLRNASVGSLKGLCPFHDEKSPSFNVRPAQGFYHCFGCGEGGDVFKFVQQLDGISFTEAVEKLASRVGFTLTYEAGSGNNPNPGLRNRILEANEQAAGFYRAQLLTDEGEAARSFLIGRGFDQAAVDHFGIGYAPRGWDNLVGFLKSAGFTIDELISAGLAAASDKGGYDKFRGRVMWPIRDQTGACIGFGARKLYEDDNGPKYLNTSDTPVYHKSQVLYGIDLARKDISKGRQVVVVEGYTDVMACHLAGITTAVATCGTAFGEDHIRVLNRLLSSDGPPAEVIFTFDPDAAGQKAAMRAFEDSHKFQAHTFVAVGPDGLDPSDLRQQRGNEAVQDMIKARRPLFEFAIRQRLSQFNLDSLEGRVSAARAAAPIVAGIRDEALRPAYARELAGWVSLPPEEVGRMVSAALKDGRNAAVAGLRTDHTARPAVPASDQVAAPVDSGTPQPAQPRQFPPVSPNDPLAQIERQTLEVLVQCPQAFNQGQLQRLASSGFAHPALNAILQSLVAALSADGDTWLARIQVTAPESLQSMLLGLAAAPLPVASEDKLLPFAQAVVGKALERALSREKAEALAKLTRTDAVAAPQGYAEIQRRLVEIERERRALMGE
jgi:DNA primase